MKIFSGLKLCIGAAAAVALIGVASAAAPTPVSNVQVTLKGKKYQIDDVTTVSELQERLEDASGIPPSKQGKILHQGKRLNSSSSSSSSPMSSSLSEAGVAEGDQLNCVPSKKSTSTKKKSAAVAAPAAAATAASSGSAADSGGSLADIMKGLGLDGSDIGNAGGAGGLDDMISKMMSGGMGGGGGGAGDMPDMAESMKMMKELTNSPMFSEYMNDPSKLEEARQMILQNPMMKGMMSSMPGMSDLLEDKAAWAQAMTAAAGIMQSMDPEDMMKMMEMQGGMQGGMGGGMGGMPPGMGGMGGGAGLFDGASLSSSALDELSEGE